jgi:hypothetical protein
MTARVKSIQCQCCGKSWERPVTRGRNPLACPDCAKSIQTARIVPAAQTQRIYLEVSHVCACGCERAS